MQYLGKSKKAYVKWADARRVFIGTNLTIIIADAGNGVVWQTPEGAAMENSFYRE